MSVNTHPDSPVELCWNGVDLFLFPNRAMLLKKTRTLLVADLHLGKDQAFRVSGIPVPQGPVEQTLERLSSALLLSNARRLIVLGDLFHSPQGNTRSMFAALTAWREKHAALPVALVRGNHDHCRGGWLDELRMEALDAPADFEALRLRHCPVGESEQRVVCGHVHPAVRLKMRNGPRSLLPCFYFTQNTCMLPSFGGFTGHGILDPSQACRIFVIAGGAVIEVPRRLKSTE